MFIAKRECVRSGQRGRRPSVAPLARLECHGWPRRTENAPSLNERTVTIPSISTQPWNAVPGPKRKERCKSQKKLHWGVRGGGGLTSRERKMLAKGKKIERMCLEITSHSPFFVVVQLVFENIVHVLTPWGL